MLFHRLGNNDSKATAVLREAAGSLPTESYTGAWTWPLETLYTEMILIHFEDI